MMGIKLLFMLVEDNYNCNTHNQVIPRPIQKRYKKYNNNSTVKQTIFFIKIMISCIP